MWGQGPPLFTMVSSEGRPNLELRITTQQSELCTETFDFLAVYQVVRSAMQKWTETNILVPRKSAFGRRGPFDIVQDALHYGREGISQSQTDPTIINFHHRRPFPKQDEVTSAPVDVACDVSI
jgi:hypothetical protein